MTSVSIIGCGWLGQALAQRLLANHTKLIASYQSAQSHDKLNALNIPATQLILPLVDDVMGRKHLDNITGVDPQLFQQDVLIIAIPPQLKKGRVDYPQKIQQLVHLAELGKTQHIILLNSTAIYNGLVGKVDEASQLNVNAEKVASLLAAEQAVKSFSKRVHILRLAGLVGPDRHPGKFLQAKRVFENASATVNLVHQTDVVNILDRLIHLNSTGSKQHIYNVVSSTESDRQGYYQLAAQALNLPLPQFAIEREQSSGKKIIGAALRDELAYHYTHDDLLAWLKAPDVTALDRA
ncbi:SDR family NAD(P)-dependent oxidoreductase [Colwellia sp. C1TZA3]|uniref:SDR family NAD(P)-dependent oxidoreductase n=1 Tax=Colwellia sp. C1TZA3 TaxID=2508879 RepID=UPI0011B9752D|nr:SDR family NAD(P)-dependent oxidoreductase [Colwellia sp. C1TZA3]TWX72989.1 SDR family NAD(P)-dependent oxidoreductase [Colwellia sp. C1TZA3]